MYDDRKNIIRKGQTTIDTTGIELHWYYTGDWIEYDSIGNVVGTETYILGEPILNNDNKNKK